MTVNFTGNAGDFLKIGVAAAARGDVPLVREILKARPAWIHHVGSHGRTMLWEAAHRGRFEMVKYLVRRRADINACGTHYTPYFVEVSCYCIARFRKRHQVADYLLAKGAVIDLHTAAFLGDRQSVQAFLKKNRRHLNLGHPHYEMAGRNDEGLEFVLAPAPWATPLCYALRGGDADTVAYLIKRGAAIRGNERALFIAADDEPEMVRLLLENGADPRFAPKAHPDEGELFRIVSAFGVKPPSGKADSSELVYLCRGDRGGNPAEVRRLLDLGADVNHRDHKGKTALHRAAKAGFVKTMQILLDHGADIGIEDKDGETPLFDAVRSTIRKKANKQAAIRLLLESGADPNNTNCRDQTVLALAEQGRFADGAAARLLRRYQ